jgi:hypothetical protein
MRALAASVLALSLSAAPPAFAALGGPPDERVDLPSSPTGGAASPALAAALTVAAPATLMGVGGLLGGSPALAYPFLLTGAFSMGAGHLYAGDPLRGALVSVGFPLVVTGAMGLGQAIPGNVGWGGATNTVVGATLAGLAYTVWASHDAYQTAERKNAEAAPSAPRRAPGQTEQDTP